MRRLHIIIIVILFLTSAIVLFIKPGMLLGQEDEENTNYPLGSSQRIAAIQEKYLNPDVSLDEAIALYHKTVNDAFNIRFKRLTDEENPEKPEKLPADLDPEEHCKKMKQDGKLGLRTYCLAIELADEFDGYARALEKRKNYIESKEAVCTSDTLSKEKETIQAQLNDPNLPPDKKQEYENQLKRLNEISSSFLTAKTLGASGTASFIDRELDMANLGLDKSLAAYNEFNIAYPLHIEYKAMIENLEKYRNALAKIRTQVTEFPSRFVNASTTACT